jgi:pyruvate/2-oxoglutarate/acetoin dehydrogenase E1 component
MKKYSIIISLAMVIGIEIGMSAMSQTESVAEQSVIAYNSTLLTSTIKNKAMSLYNMTRAAVKSPLVVYVACFAMMKLLDYYTYTSCASVPGFEVQECRRFLWGLGGANCICRPVINGDIILQR